MEKCLHCENGGKLRITNRREWSRKEQRYLKVYYTCYNCGFTFIENEYGEVRHFDKNGNLIADGWS